MWGGTGTKGAKKKPRHANRFPGGFPVCGLCFTAIFAKISHWAARTEKTTKFHTGGYEKPFHP